MDAMGYARCFVAFVGAWAASVVLLGFISSPADLAVVSLGLTIIFAVGLLALLGVVGLAVFVLVDRARR